MNIDKQGWIFAQIPIWATCDPNISHGAHRLMTYLDWRQGRDDCCWPSLGRIAKDTGMRERTIRRYLRELEGAGYLVTRQRTGRSNTYALIADPDGASETYTPAPNRDVERERSHASDTPDTAVSGTRSQVSDTPDTGVRGGGSGLSGPPDTCVPHDDKEGRENVERGNENEAALALWSSVLENLQLQMTCATFDLWLADATGRREGGTVYVQLAKQEALEWVKHRLDRVVRDTVRRIFDDEDLAVAYEVRGDG